MARSKPSLAGRMEEAGYLQKTDSPEVLKTDSPEVARTKRTYYLPTDTIVLLDEIQLDEFRKTGKKPDLSDLVKDAIKLLAEAKRAS